MLKRDKHTDEETEQLFDVNVNVDKLSPIEPNPSKSKKVCRPTVKIMKYNSDYLNFGFTYSRSELGT